jgi:hypothetical protein
MWPPFTSRQSGCAAVTGGATESLGGTCFGEYQAETDLVGRIGGMGRHDSAVVGLTPLPGAANC